MGSSSAIPFGKHWEREIEKAITEAVFFIPVVTPRAVGSENCRSELNSFLRRQERLGRNDLVFPILFIPVPALKDDEKWRRDPILSIVGKSQFPDWTKLRFQPMATP